MTQHLMDRIEDAKKHLVKVYSKYAVIWEDPADLSGFVHVTHPDPNWMAAALQGGIIPPIEAYHAVKFRVLMQMADGKKIQGIVKGDKVSDMMCDLDKRGGKMLDQLAVEYPPAYAEPIGAMTEEQAIDYIIQKDIPPRVWRDYRGNRRIMAIVPVEAVPEDRTKRNAWELVA